MHRPDEPIEELKTNLNGSEPKGSVEPLPRNQWQCTSDLTPEAWQQLVDQQLKQQEAEQQAESWGNHSQPQHNSQKSDIFKDSKSMLTSFPRDSLQLRAVNKQIMDIMKSLQSLTKYIFSLCLCTAMIIKNVKPTTTVETILKALDPFAYLDERNVRLVKAKPPGARCFCFVDMDSHEVPKTILCTVNLVHFHLLSEDLVIVFVQYFPHCDCSVFLCSK